MTTSQITGTVGEVNLNNGGYTDPLTVTATGIVGSGASIGISASNAWTIVNYGSIAGSSRAINLQAGGAITNAAGGTISAEIAAVGPTRIVNYGSIQGSFGIILSGGDATVENAGTIGGHGYAVHFSGTGNNRLIVDAGAQFSSKVGANAAGTNTIELTSGGASSGTLNGLGSQYTGFQTVTIDDGAVWTIVGTEAGFAGVTVDGFNNRDTLDLTDLSFTIGNTATLDDATDVLTIKDASGNALDTLQLAGDFTGDNFVLSGDGGNGLGIRLLKSQITGTVGAVNLANGGYTDPVTVTATGVVAGGSGIGASTAWTIVNYGSITGNNRAINLQAGGAITNAAGATIKGEVLAVGPTRIINYGSIQGPFGIVLSGGDATVENAGVITAAYSVHFTGTGNNRLIVDAGAQFSGKVAANSAGTNTIELTAGASAGTLNGLGSQYAGFQSVTIDSGASWTITGTESGFAGVTIDGFNTHDILDLTDLTFTAGDTATLDSTTDVLTINDAGGNTLDTLQLAGDFTGEFFRLADDGHNGTQITEDGTPCYCPGTMILTPGGEVAVEMLRIGDRIAVLSGVARPIKWIGRRFYSGQFARTNTEILPIRIEAGALEAGVPHRDLYVSPLHALYLEGILVPAWVLVNGSTIERVRSVDRVEYFHIELETHDVVLAEGAPAETFLDDDNRGMFHNMAEFRALYPHETRDRPRYCAPRLEDGEAVEAILKRLKLRAGLRAA